MQIFCPECQRQLAVPDQAVGKTVQCPGCKTTFAVGGSASAEQIQAPVAPRPTAPETYPTSPDEAPRPRRNRWDGDDADVVLRGGGEQAQLLATGAAAWLFCAAVITLLVAAVNMVLTIGTGAFDDGPFGGFADDEEILAGMFCAGSCGVLFIAVNVLMMIGASQLRSFGAKGWVVCAIIVAFCQTLLFGGGAFFNMIFLAMDPEEALTHWAPLTLILSVCTALLNLYAGVKAILTLNNAAVDAEFGRNRSSRRRKIRWQD